ncbi:STAS domain-containing protein [Streptomyces sp. DSM 44917]|uniref:Anti-sigma factor antagonist n=1 Tax=Streptomyces boetiae TaxID=3075541 RepID=A0ABU2LDW4_9ACTN|nr:STAS domain-containing protein [Streptomyces sp. DSM 44917]MDT0309782.1 STAS domain-containing protein [Streptomyces sp. DSM 44917]
MVVDVLPERRAVPGHRSLPGPGEAGSVRWWNAAPGTLVAELRGEIDLLTAPAVSEGLAALARRGPDRLVVDLRPVTFLDCSGLRPLCRAHALMAGRGGRLSLVAGSPRVLRVLRLARALPAFTLHPDLAGALAEPIGPAHAPVRP